MRYPSIALFVLFLSPVVALAEPLTPRPLDDFSAVTFARAMAESPTVRRLVNTIGRSNVIVHIVSSPELRSEIGGMTCFVGSGGGYRYLRVTLNAGLPAGSRTAILAHELQHASEIAVSHADDQESVRRLFDQAGIRDGDTYETRAAQRIEKIVAIEVQAAAMVARWLPIEPEVQVRNKRIRAGTAESRVQVLPQ